MRFGDGAGGFGPSQEYPVTGYPRSIFAADLTNDGRPDLIAATLNSDGAGYSTLIGNADGTFQPEIRPPGMALAAIQPSGNSAVALETWLDADWNSNIRLTYSNGQGAFTSLGGAATSPGANAVAPVDLNKDAWIDVVTADGLVIQGVPGGLWYDWSQQSPLTFAGQAVTTGDFNGDGNEDVMIAGSSIVVLRGKGDATFHAPIHPSANGTYHNAVTTAHSPPAHRPLLSRSATSIAMVARMWRWRTSASPARGTSPSF